MHLVKDEHRRRHGHVTDLRHRSRGEAVRRALSSGHALRKPSARTLPDAPASAGARGRTPVVCVPVLANPARGAGEVARAR
jgi:hypothetical protein